MIPKRYKPSEMAISKAIKKQLDLKSLVTMQSMYLYDINHGNFIPTLWDVGRFVKELKIYPNNYNESMMKETCPYTGTIFDYLEGTATTTLWK